MQILNRRLFSLSLSSAQSSIALANEMLTNELSRSNLVQLADEKLYLFSKQQTIYIARSILGTDANLNTLEKFSIFDEVPVEIIKSETYEASVIQDLFNDLLLDTPEENVFVAINTNDVSTFQINWTQKLSTIE